MAPEIDIFTSYKRAPLWNAWRSRCNSDLESDKNTLVTLDMAIGFLGEDNSMTLVTAVGHKCLPFMNASVTALPQQCLPLVSLQSFLSIGYLLISL